MPVTLKPQMLTKVQPGDKTVTLVDKTGLEFRCTPGGVKSWSLRYRTGRHQRRISFGLYSDLSLADARQKVRDARKLLSDGIDPALIKEQRRDAETFADLADAYIAHHAMKKKRSWKVDRWMLDSYVLPHWKNRLARDITRRDVRELVEQIAESAPVLANRVISLLSKVFKVGLDREIVEASPAVKITRPGAETKRDRVLTDDEIRQFWTATDALDAPMRAYWRLRLLTAQRGVEVNTMQWADIDLNSTWWRIPAAVAKNKLSHRIPLSKLAIDLLKVLPKDATYVLDGARGKRQQREAAATFNIPDFRGHDLRRTAATKMASAGIGRLVIGKVLNHVEPGVTAVYDRHSYDGEKVVALDTWARTLLNIIEKKDSNVVAFPAKS